PGALDDVRSRANRRAAYAPSPIGAELERCGQDEVLAAEIDGNVPGQHADLLLGRRRSDVRREGAEQREDRHHEEPRPGHGFSLSLSLQRTACTVRSAHPIASEEPAETPSESTSQMYRRSCSRSATNAGLDLT